MAQPPAGFHSGLPFPGSIPAADRARPETTLVAVERFACLAERCEDTCCRDWAVSIDRASLDRLKGAIARTPAGHDRLVRLVVLGSPSRHVDALGQVQLDDKGACVLLEPDNRCSVHAAFGEESLPTTCAIFPRTAIAVGGRIEVGASLGCPEIARLVLLTSDGLTMRSARQPMLTRQYVGKTVGGGDADAYSDHFLTVRELLLSCFRRNVPLGTRLVLAADFAQRVGALLHAGTTEFDGARRPFAERTLRAEIADTMSVALVASLNGDLEALDAPGDATASLIASWLAERRRLPHSQRFAELLEGVFASLRQEAGVPTGGGGSGGDSDAIAASELWRIHARRRDALQARAGARSDLIFANYGQHFLLRSPYTDAPTLLEYLTKLAVHLAAVRFLTVNHPELVQRLAAPADRDADEQTLDRVAVHAIQTFTKAIGHSLEFTETLISSARVRSGFTFGRLVMLAKFV
jgi:lysine-N-methylase